MNDHFPSTRVLERPGVVDQAVASPSDDSATLLPGMAVEAASRAFDLAYHEDADELGAALLAAAPLIRISEVDDAMVEIDRKIETASNVDVRRGMGQIRDLLAARRVQLGAVR